MPEFYGLIKRIRQRDITIQYVNIDHLRQWFDEDEKEMARKEDEYLAALDEYLAALNEYRKTGKKPKLKDLGIHIHRLKEIFSVGPKVTLSCANQLLVDKAIELIGICKFEVKEGEIVKIEKAKVREGL